MGNSGNGEVATASVSTCLGEAEVHLNLKNMTIITPQILLSSNQALIRMPM